MSIQNRNCHPRIDVRLILVIGSLLLCPLVNASSANIGIQEKASEVDSPELIVHASVGGTSALRSYKRALIKLILETSKDKYGPYQLKYDARVMSVSRSIIAIQKGEIHTGFNPDLKKAYARAKGIELITLPYMKTLSGLRKFLVRNEDLARFKQISSLEELKTMRAGQGGHWPGTFILQENGLAVVKADRYNNLFPMLQNKRFDYIPLSVLEIESALKHVIQAFPNFRIAPDIYIFHPIPLHITVSKTHPRISARIKYGAETALTNGSLDKLLHEFFQATKEINLTTPKTRLFILDNTLVTSKQNKNALTYFKKHYLNLGLDKK